MLGHNLSSKIGCRAAPSRLPAGNDQELLLEHSFDSGLDRPDDRSL
jgi:hypothetical protein